MLSIFVLWLVATIDFAIFSLPVGEMTGFMKQFEPDFATKEALKMAYGYYESLPVKYVKYLRNMFTFGVVYPYFGWSTLKNQYVAEGMIWRLPITIFLLGTALVGSIIVGIPIGVFAASKRGTKKDVALMGSALITWGIPVFFIQLIVIGFFTRVLYAQFGIKVFATTFGTPLGARGGTLQWWAGTLSTLTLPILTLVLVGFGSWALYTRNLVIDAYTQDFVVTARAKGLSERTVLYKHTFKNVLPTLLTLVSVSLPAIVTGSLVTETVFGIEGIGRWFLIIFWTPDFGPIVIQDNAVAAAVFFVFATIVVLSNLIIDLLYGVLDPRIRIGTRK
jgi:peptide/nickel transport system permease protein